MPFSLADNKLDACVILSPENRYYFTNFRSSFGCVILTEKEKIFLTDPRYLSAAKDEIKIFSILPSPSGGLLDTIEKELKRLGVKNVGYEDGFLTVGSFKDFKNTLKDFTLKPASALLQAQRKIKSDFEVECIKHSQEIAEAALKKAFTFLKPGIAEREFCAEIIRECYRMGADSMSFEPIVAFGENTARPHHRPTVKKLEKNDLIMIDFGVKHSGYCSDLTRTFCLGTPAEELVTIFDIVLKAQEYALKHIRAGITGHEADSLAREYIRANGYDKEFGHSLGHGVGIDIHESPRLGEDSQDILMPGMVVTVEPGIYLESLGGVRIEDMVLVTETGIENLTYYEKILEI